MTDRPVPVPDEASAPFWAATAKGELVLARCAACGRFAHPPEPVCPNCGEGPVRFEPVEPEGEIRSWTVIRQSFLAGFDDVLPFVLVDVDLGDDVRLIGRLVDGPDVELQLGDRVQVVFEDGVPAFALGGP